MSSEPAGVDRGIDPDVELRLAALERESDERRRQLQDVMQSLPAAVSRRDVMRHAAGDLASGGWKTALDRLGHQVKAIPQTVRSWWRRRPSR